MGKTGYTPPSLNCDRPSEPELSRRAFFRAAACAGLSGLAFAAGWNALASDSLASDTTTEPVAGKTSWNETRVFPVCGSPATDIAATPDGQLVLVKEKELVLVTMDGVATTTWPMTVTVSCIAALDKHILLLGSSGRVLAFDRRSGETRPWANVPDANLTALAAAPEKSHQTPETPAVAAADASGKCVYLFTASGQQLALIGGGKTFHVPSPFFSVAFAGNTLVIADPGRHRVTRYSFAGELLDAWGEPGESDARFCGCCNPARLAVLASGEILTSEKGTPRVKVLSPTGQLQQACHRAASGHAPDPVAALPDGGFAVLDLTGQTIRRFARTQVLSTENPHD